MCIKFRSIIYLVLCWIKIQGLDDATFIHVIIYINIPFLYNKAIVIHKVVV